MEYKMQHKKWYIEFIFFAFQVVQKIRSFFFFSNKNYVNALFPIKMIEIP